ncbi:MAG: hypothetical protein RJA61_204 [Candidatus Parcubacteria bacterium]|jgi:glucokinase
MAHYLLFDIGGTKMRFAVSKNLETFERAVTISNPEDYTIALEEISRIVRDLSKDEPFTKVAGGITGIWNKDHTVLLNSPHLSSWKGKHVRADLEKIVGCPVCLENDSAMVGLGEAHFGGGKDFDVVVYITVSTGVGGARIVSGLIDRSSYGFEPGHQIIDFSGSVEPRFNSRGTLEGFVSGTSVLRQRGVSPKDISSQDPLWDDLAEKLAYGLYNSILHWSPDCVVLGGSMIVGNPAISIDAVNGYLKEVCEAVPCPVIKKAELRDEGGLYGALAYLKQQQG